MAKFEPKGPNEQVMLDNCKIGIVIESPKYGAKVTAFDPEDVALVTHNRWTLRKDGRRFYAMTHVPRPGGRCEDRDSVFMHNVILGVKGVDHKDCDGLNNTRDNLRRASDLQNNRNARKMLGTESQYKGVHRKGKNWMAQASYVRLGVFATEEEAARAVDNYASANYGEFARLNFPDARPSEYSATDVFMLWLPYFLQTIPRMHILKILINAEKYRRNREATGIRATLMNSTPEMRASRALSNSRRTVTEATCLKISQSNKALGKTISEEHKKVLNSPEIRQKIAFTKRYNALLKSQVESLDWSADRVIPTATSGCLNFPIASVCDNTKELHSDGETVLPASSFREDTKLPVG